MIPGAVERTLVDGKHTSIKLKTPLATFTLHPFTNKAETYLVQVTAKDLPGAFKNSGISMFGWFVVTRFPGRNAVTRPKDVKPLHGNAVLMWSHLDKAEHQRCFEYLEKLCRSEIPRIEAQAK